MRTDNLHGRAGAGVEQAFGFAIDRPARLIHNAVANHFQRHQLRGLTYIACPDSAGGHQVRGGAISRVFPMNGNRELKRTAGSRSARAVASSHSSSQPSVFMACVMAE